MTDTPVQLLAVSAGWSGLTSTAYFMVVLDSVVVITALPRMQRDLHVSLASLQWTAERLRHRLCRRDHHRRRARRPVRAAAGLHHRPRPVHASPRPPARSRPTPPS